jgi:enoyl-CoA hydratase
VPLIDGGTVRLPRLVGLSHALDLVLTGRPVGAVEALRIGLANRVVPRQQSLAAATELAEQLAAFPQACLLADRASLYRQYGRDTEEALASEFRNAADIARFQLKEGLQRFHDKEYKQP